jgi:DNA polymerase III delta prime subunit
MNDKIPWVEKYRPKKFNDIVLSQINRNILENIIKTNNFPNLLLYGLPGTGKTTTIINLIKEYQIKNNINTNTNLIHLNASDERGIDIVRNQINMFVSSNPIFNNSLKFVVLDEVDYMTKNAQQALAYLIEQNTNNVRFCLICNYISRIELCLQDKFILLRFNSLPQEEIKRFLLEITKNESINIFNEYLINIINFYKSDIRSMINYIQSNNNNIEKIEMITYNDILLILKELENKDNINKVKNIIDDIIKKRNTNKNEVLKEIINYIILYEKNKINHDILKLIKFILHSKNEINNIYEYSLLRLNTLLAPL